MEYATKSILTYVPRIWDACRVFRHALYGAVGVRVAPGGGGLVIPERTMDQNRMADESADRSRDTLYAFYDLEICTVTFDFFSFLLRAEIARKMRGFKSLFIVFVPGVDDGFRMMHFDGEASRWRMRNIQVPGCRLLPSVQGVMVCEDRSEAAAIEDVNRLSIFPEGYTTRIVDSQEANDVMIDAFMFAGLVAEFIRGTEIPKLSPSENAKSWVTDWLKEHCGDRRPIVITLREYLYDPLRNSNLEAWVAFARDLDPTKFSPVFVRDTETVFEPVPENLKQFPICTEPSVNIDIRVALYEAAYLNMLVNNGPLALCYLNPAIRYLVFKLFNAAQSEEAKATFAVYGIPMFRQTPMATAFQRNAWKDDTIVNLTDEFYKIVAEIEFAENSGRSAELVTRRRMTEEEAFVSAMSMHSVGRADSAAIIYECLLQGGLERADIVGMLGLARYHQGRNDEAVQLLRCAVTLDPMEASHYFNLGIAYRALDCPKGAVDAFKRTLELDRTMCEASENLGDLYLEAEDWRQAAENFAVAIAGGADNNETLRAFAQCLVKLNRKADAYAVFSRIIANEKKRNSEIEEGALSINPSIAKVHSDMHNHLVLPRTGRDLHLRL